MVQAGYHLLRDEDYLALNRLLGILKLGTSFRGKVSFPEGLAKDLYTPFILSELREPNPRWAELAQYFDAARRLAYLNQDTRLAECPITIGLSPLLSNLVDPKGLTSQALDQSREILAAYEHTVYERFYHRPVARKVVAVVAWCVFELLRNEGDAIGRIVSWMYDHRLDVVMHREQLQHHVRKAQPVGSVSWRSLFPTLTGGACSNEMTISGLLRGHKRPARAEICVSQLQYVPPDSQYAIEPEHIYIDAFTLGAAEGKHVGRLLRWVADELDGWSSDPSDDIVWMVKPDLGRHYNDILQQLVRVARPGVNVEVRPWALSRLGKFPARGSERDDVPIWLASPDLLDSFTKHIVRRPRSVPKGYESQSNELQGLSQLRSRLRSEMQSRRRSSPRRRYFLITASIRLSRTDDRDGVRREFDGGILQVSSRTGGARLHLLETKGAQTPQAAANVLTLKLRDLDLKGRVTCLKSRSAYATLIF